MLLAIATLAVTTAKLDTDRLLEAIAEVETGSALHLHGDDFAQGRDGERGRYQLKRITWIQHSHLPFNRAFDFHYSKNVAEAHLLWLAQSLHRWAEPVTPYALALAFHVGLSAYSHDEYTAGDKDYAQRVSNLYEALAAH